MGIGRKGDAQNWTKVKNQMMHTSHMLCVSTLMRHAKNVWTSVATMPCGTQVDQDAAYSDVGRGDEP